MIIGLVGRKYSGKTTLATLIEKRLYYKTISFADPFKHFKEYILEYQGCSMAEMEDLVYLSKERPSRYFGGHTSRHISKTIGTDWGRKIIGEDFWVKLLDNHINHYFSGVDIVIDDVRYLNEAQYVKQKGGYLIRLERDDENDVPEYEVHLIKVDYSIDNNQSIMDMYNGFEICFPFLR